MLRRLILAAILLLAASLSANATDFWVATTGSDANAGTQAAPYLTIGRAEALLPAGFGAGSTVHVAPGSYLGSVGLALQSGTALNTTGTIANGSRVITAMASTTGVAVGQFVWLPGGGAPTGAAVAAFTATTVTLNGPITATATATPVVIGTAPITYKCDVKWSCRIAPTTSETNNFAWSIGGGGTYANNITTISSDSNAPDCSGATPCLEITFTETERMVLHTGDYVSVSAANANTCALGQWQITRIDSTHITLNGSIATGCTAGGALGIVREGAAGAYTIIDGFEIDATYPGAGTKWFTGIAVYGTHSVVQNSKIHEVAYPPGSSNGTGGSCISTNAFRGGFEATVANNLVYHCGPKGVIQSTIHGIYIQRPKDSVFNNIIWGVSGLGIDSWHQSTAQTEVNNTCADCLDGGPPYFGAGDTDWPHAMTGTPTNGSAVIGSLENTAGLVAGMGVYDLTNPTCFGDASFVTNKILSVDNANQVTVNHNGGSACTALDTIQFAPINVGSIGANNLCYNSATRGEATGLVGVNTYTNNLGFTCPSTVHGGGSFVNDITTDPKFVQYNLNDGNNSDYHLGSGSPAIAAGTATNAPPYDYEGNPVPLGTAPEIGAYAWNPNPHAPIDKLWNWVPGGYSSAFSKTITAASSATVQGTNGIGAKTDILSLDGLGNLRLPWGSVTAGWPVGGSQGAGSGNFVSLYVNGVQLAPSPVPNPLINPSMDFDQQLAVAGTAYTLTNNATASKTLDGWNAIWNCAATCPSGLTVAQVSTSPPTGFANYLKATITTGAAAVAAGDYLILYQPVEAANTTNYGFGGSGAQPLCFSFYSASSVLNAIVGGAIQNAAQTRSYPFIFAESATANTWQVYNVCLPGDIAGAWVTAGAAEGLRVVFALEAGSTFQTATIATAGISGLPGSTFVPNVGIVGAWAATNYYGSSALTQLTKTTGATFSVTGVQLEQSTAPNPFRRDGQFDEVQKVQRYSWRLAEPAVGVNVGACEATAAAVQTCMIFLPTPMRAAPTSTITTGTFAENMGGTATTWVTPASGTSTLTAGTVTTANTLDIAGAYHMLQGGGGTGVILFSARL